MKTPVNRFKKAITEKRAQIGLWVGLASSYSAEICAMAGFDWLLIDGEHAPNNLQSIQQQLQTIAAYPVNNAIARVPVGDAALIKQYLDLGAETLLIPMVDTPEQAAHLVQAMRYPQNDGKGGIRGMGGARDAIARILKAGKAPGILTSDEAQAKHYLALGALFVAVGLDTQILVRQTAALAKKFKPNAGIELPASGQVY